MNNGYYVLVNSLGQVARTLNIAADEFSLVYDVIEDRVRAVPTTAPMKKNKVIFEELARIKKREIIKNPVTIEGLGTLNWVSEVENLSPSPSALPEDEKTIWDTFAFTGLFELGLLFVILALGRMYSPKPEDIVTVSLPPPSIVKPITSAQSSNAERSKIDAILGMIKGINPTPGISPKVFKTSSGSGPGGNQGSGGLQTRLLAAGILSASLGPGTKPTGGGGYGVENTGGSQGGKGPVSLAGLGKPVGLASVATDGDVEGGGLDRNEIAAVIQKHIGQIRYCYEEGLQLSPNLMGRVAIRFFINGKGTVNRADIINTSLHSKNVESCMAERLRTWKFPEPRGGVIVKVTYPFILRRVSQT